MSTKAKGPLHAEALQRAEERIAIHELIRLGVGRHEDLRLLQKVGLPTHTRTHWAHTLSCTGMHMDAPRGCAADLQVALLDDEALPTRDSLQLVREGVLREEWRSQREAVILEQLQYSNFESCSDKESQMLQDQVLALQQVGGGRGEGGAAAHVPPCGQPPRGRCM